MYTDLSIVPTNQMELSCIAKKIKNEPYSHIVFDYAFKDELITPIKQPLNHVLAIPSVRWILEKLSNTLEPH